MNHSYPVQVAEYAISNYIADEPAFSWWWVHNTAKRRDRILARILSNVKSKKYWQCTHKSVQEAIEIDRENGNTPWWDAICQEMTNVRQAFEKLEKKEGELPPGYQMIKCHFTFDIKMVENCRRKARLVTNGNETEVPAALTYSSVVTRDSVRIALLIASLNDLQLLACNMQNPYVAADFREKICITAGSEFGSEEEGTTVVIRKALYGLKSSGAGFRAHLADTLYDLGYTPSKAVPDV